MQSRLVVRGPVARVAALAALSLALASTSVTVTVATAPPASAAGKVSVSNSQGSRAIDPTYATRLKVSGSGFQSIKGGHGGIYVFFGTVKGTWQPSKGGQTGSNLLYVPDSESRNNQGFQKFVTFPGSDTASAANGGEISTSGRWSTTITVPGAVFKARDRSNEVTTVDCRKVTCGIITIGAHGVKNATNESFTPVSVKDLTQGGATPSTQQSAAAAPDAEEAAADAATEDETDADEPATPTLVVDRETAVAGRVLSFSATGLEPGEQVTATLDDGLVAVGPLTAGPDGQLAGALQLPPDLGAGTHQLRLAGGSSGPAVMFPVSESTTALSATTTSTPRLPVVAAGVALAVLLGAVLFAALRTRAVRRKGGNHDATVA